MAVKRLKSSTIWRSWAMRHSRTAALGEAASAALALNSDAASDNTIHPRLCVMIVPPSLARAERYRRPPSRRNLSPRGWKRFMRAAALKRQDAKTPRRSMALRA